MSARPPLKLPPLTPRHDFAAPEDWRVLRLLAGYRLVLIGLLTTVLATGFAPYFVEGVNAGGFYSVCVIYGLGALGLIPFTIFRIPRLSLQAHLGFAVDVAGLLGLVYMSRGIGSGFGVLLITPAVGGSLILSTRMALLHAATASVGLMAEEFVRQSQTGFSPSETTETGLLGLILFVTVVAANAMARRARKSEALAERVGVDLANLSQLNNRIIESMETGVLVVGDDRRLRLLNVAARRLLSAGAQIEGQRIEDVFPDLAALLDRWDANPDLSIEPIAPWAGSDEVLPRFMRLGWSAGSPVLILLDDATRLRAQAQQIKLAALGRLSASIAHEIRNPLSAIHHAGQLLAESTDIATADRRLVDMVQRHSLRIDKIVQDVLRLSKRDLSVPVQFALREFLERTLATYQEAHTANPRDIDLGGVGAEHRVRFDPNHLSQILHNLWDNSFEHGRVEEGPAMRIGLRASRQGAREQVTLDIVDNGRGIPAEVRDRVFEPFFTTAHRGTGLGLYLARELCDYNQARLDYVADGPGAHFKLVFAA